MVSNLGSEAVAWLDRDGSEHAVVCAASAERFPPFLFFFLTCVCLCEESAACGDSTAADSANKSQMCSVEQLLCLGLLRFSEAEISARI